jgi:RimJ/RimL family protein N-acetyltransferase
MATSAKSPEREISPVTIERASPDDAQSIMTLKRAAWFVTYPSEERGITLKDIRKKFTDEDMLAGTENWQRGIGSETEDGARMTFVARVDGTVVGYTSPHTTNGQKRIGALYVSPDMQGKGVGSQLLQKAIDWHGRENDIYLHVVSYNQRAIDLYERFGFEKTDTELPDDYHIGDIKTLPQIEMVLKADIPVSNQVP